MAPRPADPFKPGPDESYSKGEVNRAGQLLRTFYGRDLEPGENLWDSFDVDKVVKAMVAVTWWRSLHARPLSQVAAGLRYHVAQEDAEVRGRIDVAQRLKRRNTIIDKLEREPRMNLTQMQDIGGVRARLPSLKHIYALNRRLQKTWTIQRTRDYIQGPPGPRSSGYRALHVIVRRGPYQVELQLRTVLQDAWANQVEEDSRRLGIGFKFGRGGADVHRYYVLVSEVFAHQDRDEDVPSSLAADLSAQYQLVVDKLGRRRVEA